MNSDEEYGHPGIRASGLSWLIFRMSGCPDVHIRRQISRGVFFGRTKVNTQEDAGRRRKTQVYAPMPIRQQPGHGGGAASGWDLLALALLTPAVFLLTHALTIQHATAEPMHR